MDTRDLHDKGLKLRREMFGRDAVEQRMTARCQQPISFPRRISAPGLCTLTLYASFT